MEGQVEVLKEQIHGAKQNEEHYKSRKISILSDTEKRQCELESYQQERSSLKGEFVQIQERQLKEEVRLRQMADQIEACVKAVEEGKNEIIEVLNSRANTKGKVQRFDTMLEQINIRRAQLNQRNWL